VGENETQNTAAVQQQGLQPASASLSSQNSAAAVAVDAAADQVMDTSVSESEAPQLVAMESMSGLTQWEPDNETFIDWEIGGKAGACTGCVCLFVCLSVCGTVTWMETPPSLASCFSLVYACVCAHIHADMYMRTHTRSGG
jgi:hypothetical protein